MAHVDVLFRGQRVVTPSGERPASVGVLGGRIATVGTVDAAIPADRVVELTEDEVLLPGLVDTHVHVNDPGRSEWEGFATATRAAAAGGITTIVDMPLNSVPPTVDTSALEVKRKSADGKVFTDVGFWGGAVPGNLGELPRLHRAGVFGFKCFLLESGVPEFGHLDRPELHAALLALRQDDALMIVHAEDAEVIERTHGAGGRHYRDFLASRPNAAENSAIDAVIAAARETGARVHIVHLSSAEALPAIRAAREDGVRLTVETCPHYLTFCAEDIPDGATEFKCCPPIRETKNRDLLWQALADGVIDCVVSDHSPCTPELKQRELGDFSLAWGGIASLQLGLPAVWTQARLRGVGLGQVARWMSTRSADLVGLHRKGRIEPGSDADLCVFAPEESFVVDAQRLFHRNPVTPYHGRELTGVVRSTWLRGKEITGEEPHGMLLTRGES